jgi:hypothetical protein
MSTNYTSLVEDILKYIERGSAPSDGILTSTIPTIVRNAEDRISKDLMISRQARVVNYTIQNGDSVILKPSDWIDNISFSVTVENRARNLKMRSLEYVNTLYQSSQSGSPLYYANYDATHWLIAPAANLDYQSVIKYHAIPQRLSPSNQTNWATQFIPNLLLKACLAEASLFMKNTEDYALFTQEYKDLVPTEIARDGLSQIDSNIRMPKK